jgi:hypothetical protein
MKRTLKIVSLVAALCALLTAVSGCGRSDAGSPDVTSANGVVLAANTLIITVDSTPVYWPEFRYALKFITNYYKDQYGLETITDWDVEVDGTPLDEYFLSAAAGYATKNRAMEAKAKELGIELTQDELAEIAEVRADNISIYGSEREYLTVLTESYYSEDVYDYLIKMGYLSADLFAELYGANGERCADEEVSEYVAEKGLMCADYVFLSNTAADGSELSDEEKRENRSLLQNLIGRLDLRADPAALFPSLVAEYNEDSTLSGYPDGRLFLPGAVGDKFESACAALREHEYSGVVEQDEGLYLIMRMPIFPDMIADSSGNTLRYWAAFDYLFQSQVDEWVAGMEIGYTETYYTLDVEALFK